MQCLMDVHTHTIASVHAYSTIGENIAAAKRRGLKLIGISDHGPAMPGSFHEWYFCNFKVIKAHEADYGIKLVTGVELNIIDYRGSTDLRGDLLSRLDYAIASLHEPCLKPGRKEENTRSLIGAMENPLVKIIGHPDNPRFPVDYDELVLAAKAHGVLLEVNNSSYSPQSSRQGSKEAAALYLAACKRHEAKLIIGSDAHLDLDVGECGYARQLLRDAAYPEELIINSRPEEFLAILAGLKP